MGRVLSLRNTIFEPTVFSEVFDEVYHNYTGDDSIGLHGLLSPSQIVNTCPSIPSMSGSPSTPFVVARRLGTTALINDV